MWYGLLLWFLAVLKVLCFAMFSVLVVLFAIALVDWGLNRDKNAKKKN